MSSRGGGGGGNISEEERRRNEISMFAAMALGDEYLDSSQGGAAGWSGGGENARSSSSQPGTARGLPRSASPHTTTTTTPASKKKPSLAEHTVNGVDSTATSRSNKRQLLRRRQQQQHREKNKGNNDAEDGGGDDPAPRRRMGLRKHAPKPARQQQQQQQQQQQHQQQQQQPTLANQQHPKESDMSFNNSSSNQSSSGTFAFDSLKPVTSMEKSNLAAALAALERDSAPSKATAVVMDHHAPHPLVGGPSASSVSSPLNPNNGNAAQQGGGGRTVPQHPFRKPENTAPMVAEQVFMPRPLFFGPLVPPRVVRQAREMVLDASKDHHQPPCLEELPGSVRNLVGALRVYGYGIDVLHELKEDTDDAEFWRGSPYLSTYQPLWGEEERAQRIQQIEEQQRKRRSSDSPIPRPSILSRSSTAPSRLVPHGGIDDKNGMVVVDLDSGTTVELEDEDEDSILHESKSDRLDLAEYQSRSSPNFLASAPLPAVGDSSSENMVANNASQPPGLGGGGSLSLSQTYSSSSWSPLHQTQSSQSSTYNNSNPLQQQQITANEQFSAWIRGDDDGAVATATSNALLGPRGDNSGGSFIAQGGDGNSVEARPSLDNWLRQGQATTTTTTTTTATTTTSLESMDFSSKTNNNKKKAPLTEQEMFSQWALGADTSGSGGGGGGGTFCASSAGTTSDDAFSSSTLLGEQVAGGGSTGSDVNNSALDSLNGTFQRRPSHRRADSDDDSVEHDEKKRQGMLYASRISFFTLMVAICSFVFLIPIIFALL